MKEEHTSLDEIAKFILSDECRSIAVLMGAGASVASGIPDFRSSGGMYDSIRPETLTACPTDQKSIKDDCTLIAEREFFLKNQLPLLEAIRPLVLGARDRKWKATLAHRFVELLQKRCGKLTRLYTQNVDGLEYQCDDLPSEKVEAVHGSITAVSCELCESEDDFNQFCDAMQSSIKDIYTAQPPDCSSTIPCKICGCATLKPSVVLFDAPLPDRFFTLSSVDMPNVDLFIVIGTSLTVYPVNQLVASVPSTASRLIINKEPVGMHLGVRYDHDHIASGGGRDFFAQGDCETVVLDLMRRLGWIQELHHLISELPESSAKLLASYLDP